MRHQITRNKVGRKGTGMQWNDSPNNAHPKEPVLPRDDGERESQVKVEEIDDHDNPVVVGKGSRRFASEQVGIEWEVSARLLWVKVNF